KFWQKTQRRLHQEKKMVPEPRQPRSTSSSPKWGKALATRACRPTRHTPCWPARRSTPLHSRGQARHDGPRWANASSTLARSRPPRPASAVPGGRSGSGGCTPASVAGSAPCREPLRGSPSVPSPPPFSSRSTRGRFRRAGADLDKELAEVLAAEQSEEGAGGV